MIQAVPECEDVWILEINVNFETRLLVRDYLELQRVALGAATQSGIFDRALLNVHTQH